MSPRVSTDANSTNARDTTTDRLPRQRSAQARPGQRTIVLPDVGQSPGQPQLVDDDRRLRGTAGGDVARGLVAAAVTALLVILFVVGVALVQSAWPTTQP